MILRYVETFYFHLDRTVLRNPAGPFGTTTLKASNINFIGLLYQGSQKRCPDIDLKSVIPIISDSPQLL
jgi:hypothetical protein